MADNLLIIFVKNMVPGMVKTRLAEKVGMFLALDVYHELVAHTADVIKKVDADKVIFYSEYVEVEDMFDAEDIEYNVQTGNTLGERMQNAFQVLMVLMDDKTGEPEEGNYYPLIIHRS